MDFFANAFQERVITSRPSEKHKQSQRELEGRGSDEDDKHIVKDGIAIKPKEADPPLVSTNSTTIMCEICGSQPAKYKCPGCLCQTCSLPCSKQHKADTTCSGQRSRTHFIDRKQYSEQDMMSDYNFLQEMGRFADNAARENLNLGGLTNIQRLQHHNKRGRGRGGRGGHNGHHHQSPLIQELDAAQELELQGSMGLNSFKDKQLVRQAKLRGTQLVRMAEGLKRHKENQSYWNTKYKNMIWTIEWLFPEVGTTPRRILAHRNIDTHQLKDLLSKQLAPSPVTTPSQGENESQTVNENQDLADRYPLDKLDQCRLFFQVPLRNTKKPALYQLDVKDTLHKALSFKKVLEYPTILVFGPEEQQQPSGTEEQECSGNLLDNYTIEEAPTSWPSTASRRTRDSNQEEEGDDDDDVEDEGRPKKKAKVDVGEADEESSEANSSSDDDDSANSDSDSDSDTDDSDSDGSSAEEGSETSEAVASVEDGRQEADGDNDNEEAAHLIVGQALLEAFAQDFGEKIE